MRDHDEVFRRVMEAKEQYEQQEKTRFGSVFTTLSILSTRKVFSSPFSSASM